MLLKDLIEQTKKERKNKPKKVKKNARSYTGYKHLIKIKDKRYRKGYYYQYNHNGLSISRTKLSKMEDELHKHNINLIIDNEEAVAQTLEQEEIMNKIKKKSRKRNKNNTSGYDNISIQRNNTCKQKYLYKYQKQINGEKIALTSTDLEELKKKIKMKEEELSYGT